MAIKISDELVNEIKLDPTGTTAAKLAAADVKRVVADGETVWCKPVVVKWWGNPGSTYVSSFVHGNTTIARTKTTNGDPAAATGATGIPLGAGDTISALSCYFTDKVTLNLVFSWNLAGYLWSCNCSYQLFKDSNIAVNSLGTAHSLTSVTISPNSTSDLLNCENYDGAYSGQYWIDNVGYDYNLIKMRLTNVQYDDIYSYVKDVRFDWAAGYGGGPTDGFMLTELYFTLKNTRVRVRSYKKTAVYGPGNEWTLEYDSNDLSDKYYWYLDSSGDSSYNTDQSKIPVFKLGSSAGTRYKLVIELLDSGYTFVLANLYFEYKSIYIEGSYQTRPTALAQSIHVSKSTFESGKYVKIGKNVEGYGVVWQPSGSNELAICWRGKDFGLWTN